MGTARRFIIATIATTALATSAMAAPIADRITGPEADAQVSIFEQAPPDVADFFGFWWARFANWLS